jgi:hypothetical protein
MRGVIRTATGKLVQLDQTREPVSCTLNLGTANKVTVMAHVVIVKHNLPDTLIGMSVTDRLGCKPGFHKECLKYYIDWGTPNARKAFLKCQFSIDFDTALPDAITEAYYHCQYEELQQSAEDAEDAKKHNTLASTIASQSHCLVGPECTGTSNASRA